MPRQLMQLEFALDEAPSVAKLRPGAALRRLLLPSGSLWYSFLRARRRTLTIVVERGQVEVRAPRWTSIGEVESFLREKEAWIRKRILEAHRSPPPFRWRSGESFPVLGVKVTLAAEPGSTGVRRAGERLCVGCEPDAAEAMRGPVMAWLAEEAKNVFAARVAIFARLLDVPVPELKLSNARTQWGSCSAHGRVRLNWRLIHVPLSLVDYVVVHELAHLRELNHSRRFWALVESAYPGFRAARRELNRIEKQLPAL